MPAVHPTADQEPRLLDFQERLREGAKFAEILSLPQGERGPTEAPSARLLRPLSPCGRESKSWSWRSQGLRFAREGVLALSQHRARASRKVRHSATPSHSAHTGRASTTWPPSL